MEEIKKFKQYLNESKDQILSKNFFPFDGLNVNLSYVFKDENDNALANLIDSYVIDAYFHGNQESYEENNGYELRDEILKRLFSPRLDKDLDNLIHTTFQNFLPDSK